MRSKGTTGWLLVRDSRVARVFSPSMSSPPFLEALALTSVALYAVLG